jgi:voltage-gated potassium channel
MILEERNFLESLYFVIATITTVGYGDIVPQTPQGKILSIFLIILGAGAVLALIPLTFSYFMEKGLREALGIKSIPKLKNHIIVCRYNDLAKQTIEEIKAHNLPFIVVEDEASPLANLKDLKIPYIDGDPSEERTLEKASIDKATSIILTSRSDSENAFVAMAAKTLNPKVKIIARANSSESIPIYRRVGVDRIVDPNDITLKILVKNALSPYAADMLDQISILENINLGQFQITADSPIVGKSIAETKFRTKTGASIVAIWRRNEMHPNPSPQDVLEENDVLLVLGTASQLNKAKALLERQPSKLEISEMEREAQVRRTEAANEIRVRLPKVTLNVLIILGLLFAVTVVLPSLTAVWTLVPHVGSALGALLPIVAWIVIAMIVFSIMDDVRVLLNISSEVLTGLFPGVKGRDLNRVVKDIVYAIAAVISLTIISQFTTGAPPLVKSLLSVVTIVIPVFFLYDAGRILYKHLTVIVDRIAEKVAGEVEKK